MTMISRFAAAVVVFLPATAVAQVARDTAEVAPVTVTASRSPLQVDRTPASVTVVSGADLRAQGITHLTDALRGVPGLTVVQSGSTGAPASLFVRGGQSNYTKVLIDGVPANEPGGAFDFGTLTVDDVERIEIVRGPSSVVWGSDAVSAVVHVITRRGMTDETRIAARGGSHGTADVTAAIERGRGGVNGAITAAHHISDGFHAFNSDYRSSLIGGSATLGAPRRGTLRVNGRYADVTAHFPTDFTGAPVDPNAFRTEARSTASAELTQPVGRLTTNLLVTHSLVVASSVDPANAPTGSSTTFDTRSRRQQVELRAEAPLAPWARLTAGGVLEAQRRTGAFNTLTTSGTEPDSRDRQVTHGARENRGAYAEVLGTADLTTMTIGGRLDHSGVYGDFSTWRAALSHRLRSTTRLRASIGTAFREPSFDETLPSAFSAGNPDIVPERTSSWEVGAEQRVAGDRLVIGATYFQQRFTNMIDYFAEEFPGRYENVAAARARGTELELRLTPAPEWVVDGSVTLVKTRVETAGFGGSFADGRALLRRPERTATAGLTRMSARGTAAIRLAHVGARSDVRYFHDAPYSAEQILSAYTRVDVSGELPVATRRGASVALTMRIDNIGGARYEPAAGYDAPGRTFLAGVRAGF